MNDLKKVEIFLKLYQNYTMYKKLINTNIKLSKKTNYFMMM